MIWGEQRKRGTEGQVTIIRHFGIRCIALVKSDWVIPEGVITVYTLIHDVCYDCYDNDQTAEEL